MDADYVWQTFGLEQLNSGIEALFPNSNIDIVKLFTMVFSGDILGSIRYLLVGGIQNVGNQIDGIKSVFIWILVLGVVSAIMNSFIEAFDKHQISDLGFYFVYLLMASILIKCFMVCYGIAEEILDNIVVFVQMLVPTYLFAVGVSTGTSTFNSGSQLMVLIIYGIERIIIGIVLKLIFSNVIISLINSVCLDEKMGLIIELVEKFASWILKGVIGVVTGISVFQTLITPMVDNMKASTFKKALGMIPGVGNTADGIVELAAGSTLIIRNSIGMTLVILFLMMCIAPLVKIFAIALLLKAAAALVGIVSDKRISSCADNIGNAGFLLLRTAGTAMLMFIIAIAVMSTGKTPG